MARVKRGVTSHARHKRLLDDAEGRKGTQSRLVKPAREALLHALAYATRDRKQRKRQMRELWIVRINAAARQNGLTYGAVHRRASRRPTSRSIARSWPTSPSATPRPLGRSSSSPRAPDRPGSRPTLGGPSGGPRAHRPRIPRRRRRSRVPDSRPIDGRTDVDLADLTRDLETLRDDALASIAASADVAALEALELDVLGKKGRLTAVLRGIGGLPADDRPRVGAVANDVRGRDRERPRRARRDAARGGADRTPGRRDGRRHDARPAVPPRHAPSEHRDDGRDRRDLRPVRVRGLREPRDRGRPDQLPDAQHPAGPPGARPVGHALRRRRRATCCGRTRRPARSTSCGRRTPPIRALLPGRCFRYEAIDASHGSEFFQVEGLMVDEGTTMGDLKGLLDQFAGGHVRRRQEDPLPARLLPVHGAVRRVRRRVPRVRRLRAARPAAGPAG